MKIHKIDRNRAQQVEPLGSKPKFWFENKKGRWLFKADDRGTGEDWAEIIACRLAGLLGLPHVEYEMAEEYDGDQYLRPGVICQNMAPAPKALLLGNQLLSAFDDSYPDNQQYQSRQHTIISVSVIIKALNSPSQHWVNGIPEGISTAMDIFSGYLMLDVWIANQDRHHENWGAIWEGEGSSGLSLCPSFDHGAGLARNITDKERAERMETKDLNRSIEHFAGKARSAFFGRESDSKPILLLDAFEMFSNRSFPRSDGSAPYIWLRKLQSIKNDDVKAILSEIPESRMSQTCKRFTLKLLEINRERLLRFGRGIR